MTPSPRDRSLAGRVAVVTGASRGIGKGIALALAAHGATVSVTGRTVSAGMHPLAGTVGENTVADEIASNRTEPSKWRPGIVTATHGVACSARGDLFVSEFNLAGRVHRFAAQAGGANPSP